MIMTKTLMFLLWNVVLVSMTYNTKVHGFSILPQSARSQSVATQQQVEQKQLPQFLANHPLTHTFSLFGKKEAREAGNERKNKTERVKKVKDDVIEIEGVVLESLPNAMFRCAIDGAPDSQAPVLATVSGKIRKNFVKILVGDKVTIELSPYDLTRGRITYRYR